MSCVLYSRQTRQAAGASLLTHGLPKCKYSILRPPFTGLLLSGLAPASFSFPQFSFDPGRHPLSLYSRFGVMLLGGVSVAVYFCWRMALAHLAVLPLFVISQSILVASTYGTNKSGTAPECTLCDEAARVTIRHTRMISSLGQSRRFLKEYNTKLAALRNYWYTQSMAEGRAAFASKFTQFGCVQRFLGSACV